MAVGLVTRREDRRKRRAVWPASETQASLKSLLFSCDRPSNIETEVRDIVSDIETRLLNDVQAIREIVAQQGRLSVDVFSLDEKSDLYLAGLTSLATVGIMLALEDRFDIEFPESMLSRKTFNRVASITEAVSQLAT